jgi:hypothetical protein
MAGVEEWLPSALGGYYQYNAVPGNIAILSASGTRWCASGTGYYGSAVDGDPLRQSRSRSLTTGDPFLILVHACPDAHFDAGRREESNPG